MKRTLILLGVSVVVLAFVLFFPKQREKKSNIEQVTLLDNKRKIQSITIKEKDKESVKIISKGISYALLLEDKELPAILSVVNSIIGLLEKKYDVQFISAKKETYSLYQLDESNRLSIEFEFVDGKQNIYFGRDVAGYKGIYFIREEKVYKLPGVEKNDLFKTRDDLVNKSIFSFVTSSVKEIEIVGKKNTLFLTKVEKTVKKKGNDTNKNEEKKITVWKNRKNKKEYDNYKVEDYLNRLASLRCENFDLKSSTQSIEKKYIKKYIISTDDKKFTLFIAKDQKAFADNQKYVFTLNNRDDEELLKDLK